MIIVTILLEQNPGSDPSLKVAESAQPLTHISAAGQPHGEAHPDTKESNG